MKLIRMMGACLIAALAVSAVAAASASAVAPEFGRCIKQTGGKFSSSGCKQLSTEEKTNKYEWYPGFSGSNPIVKPKFTTTIKPATLATLETVGGTQWTCKGVTGSGEYTGEKTVGGIVLKFTSCTSGGLPLENTGKEEVTTKVLNGQLGIEIVGTKAPENNQLALSLEGLGGGAFIEASVAGAPIVLTGSVLHPVPTNQMQETTTEKFIASKGEQKPDKFAGEGVDAHTLYSCLAGCGGTPEEFGISDLTLIQTNEEKIEASSVN